MCGIIGYTGKNNAVPYLIKGLKSLEYRGYDSAGIALQDGSGISLIKRKGKVSVLEADIDQDFIGTTGIGHTRWATHGEPSQVNAHPHLSENGIFAVVHNGIIENCHELKALLKNEGYCFISDTDTEVISQLLERNYNGDLPDCLNSTANMLEGSFAMAALHRDSPDTIICAKKGSPLIIGIGDEGTFVMSDTLATSGHSLTYYMLGDRESAVITKSSCQFYTSQGKLCDKAPCLISPESTPADKGEYPHYMLKEIYEQPASLKRMSEMYIKEGEICFSGIDGYEEKIRNADSIYLVACGSAYHAALCSVYVFRRMTHKHVSAHIASEFRYESIPLTTSSLVIIISQSGETADSLAALEYAKESGALTLAVVNVSTSSIALKAHSTILTLAGREIAVATTKAFTCQLWALYALAAFMCEDKCEKVAFINELLTAGDKIKAELSLTKAALHSADLLKSSEHIYFIGRNTDYALAMEGALKLKEISYIHCEAYAAGELKHGTISLIEKGTRVIAVCLRHDLMTKTLAAIKEVRARGAYVIALTSKGLENHLSEADFVICMHSDYADDFSALSGATSLQLISYYTAVKRNCNVDKPRNLAKSVTVE